MQRVVLPKRISLRLQNFSGETVEEKIDYLAERTAVANLRECNERISHFESRYGRVFPAFESAWKRGEIPNLHAFQTETDYIEWEALEQEKEHWLSVIRSLQTPTRSKKRREA